jgi:hypothetical protein
MDRPFLLDRHLMLVALGVMLLPLVLAPGCQVGSTTPASAPCTAAQITTPGLGGISGSVFDMKGTAAAGSSVTLDLTPVATTDGNGNFCLVNLEPRQYAVSAKSGSQGGSVPVILVVQGNTITSVTINFNTTAMPYATAGQRFVARQAATPQPPGITGDKK